MTQVKTVRINGREYDPHTGLALSVELQSQYVVSAPRVAHNSSAVHQGLQKSKTLRRTFVQKPVSKITPAKQVQRARVATSPLVSKFSPARKTPTSTFKSTFKSMDIAPQKHSAVQRAEARIAARQSSIARTVDPTKQQVTLRPAPAKDIKNMTIAQALDAAPDHSKIVKKPGIFARKPKLSAILTSGFALLILGGYFTYINMPNLSVRIAAAQAGIAATYPAYKPDGYSLNGPVSYEGGKVAMTFKANGGDTSFTLSQQKSAWDSTSVLNNYVKEKSGDQYYTYQDGGLTIYLFGSNAAWVNRGILYTIDGDAPISGQQISHIATTL